jgi:hypothetical protein
MTDPLETVLRDSFHNRVASLDSAAAARLLAIDYRPRRRRVPVVPLLGTLGLGGVTAAIVVVLLLGSGAGPAFAGWTRAPSRPAPGQIATVLQQCGSHAPVLTDTRGPYTAVVYALSNNGVGTCIKGGSLSFSSTGTWGTQGSIPADQIQTNFSVVRSGPSGTQFTILDGRVGSAVTAVRFDRSDGIAVQATVAHGWFLAWWPGSASALRTDITTPSGIHTTGPPVAGRVPSFCNSGGGCTAFAPVPSGGGGAARAQHTR